MVKTLVVEHYWDVNYACTHGCIVSGWKYNCASEISIIRRKFSVKYDWDVILTFICMVAREGGGGEGSLFDSRGILDEFKMGLLITGLRWINNEVASMHSGLYITFAPRCSKTSILTCRYTFVYVGGCVRGVMWWNRDVKINTLFSMRLIAERTPSCGCKPTHFPWG